MSTYMALTPQLLMRETGNKRERNDYEKRFEGWRANVKGDGGRSLANMSNVHSAHQDGQDTILVLQPTPHGHITRGT